MTYEELINEINEKITENGAGEITGAVLNEVLTAVVQAVTDNTAKKITVPTGIETLTAEQVGQLKNGDIVVDALPKSRMTFVVSVKGTPFTVMTSVGVDSILVVRYHNGEYYDTYEYELTQQ